VTLNDIQGHDTFMTDDTHCRLTAADNHAYIEAVVSASKQWHEIQQRSAKSSQEWSLLCYTTGRRRHRLPTSAPL